MLDATHIMSINSGGVLYPVLSLIDPFPAPPSSFHHLAFAPPSDPDPPRLTTVDKPELISFLPPPKNLGDCEPPSSSPVFSCFCFFEVDLCSLVGCTPFSHSFRCNRYTAIVALAFVAYMEIYVDEPPNKGKARTLEFSPPCVAISNSCLVKLRRAGYLVFNNLCLPAWYCVSRVCERGGERRNAYGGGQ